MTDARLYGNAVERNVDPILSALRQVLSPSGSLLEIASGSGQHVLHFAAGLPAWVFQPSDHDPAALASIDAWAAERRLPNVRPAIRLDAASDDWPAAPVDVVLCINMVHIAPWAATIGLFRAAARIVRPGGMLVLYGPFLRDGIPTAEGNIAFDADLRARDPGSGSGWGLRRLEDLVTLAAAFAPPEITPMPANNLVVVFRREAAPIPP